MEFRTDQAIYLQISDYICEMILTGKWESGAKIPSIRELAVDIEVNPNTVLRTYAYLQQKEIIFNRRGIGYFVADGASKSTRHLKQDDFISNDLPRLFKTMDVLTISIEELEKLYRQYQSQQK
ncbi:MAG: GntR family transcriptional regulator [Candidatus Marinimicrobia bacterium]|nr:GntR family transcriptional regulator [Candidatus Neomarinimicrobiota bacterium]